MSHFLIYRAASLQISTLESELREELNLAQVDELLALIKRSSPKIYKDQLCGLKQVFARHGKPDASQLSELINTPRLTVRQLEERCQQRSTVVSSQLPIEQWHEVIDDPTLADAILDRLVHQAYKFSLTGESMRKHARVAATATDTDTKTEI